MMNENLIGKELLKSKEVEIFTEVKASSLKEAFSDVFKTIHKQIYSEVELPIIQMETVSVVLEEVGKVESSDSLLQKISFDPKSKEKFRVKVKVILNIKYLDIKEED